MRGSMPRSGAYSVAALLTPALMQLQTTKTELPRSRPGSKALECHDQQFYVYLKPLQLLLGQ